MAKSLMATTRPYISSSSRPFPLYFQSQKRFISDSSILLKRTKLFLSCGINRGTTTYVHSDVNSSSCRFPQFSGFGSLGSPKFSTRATHVNDSGSIELPLMETMERKIKDDLNAELVSVKDASGDGRHVCIDVISSAFNGKSAVNRQRMVYKAIWEELQNTVHAVDNMRTRTPEEAESQK